MTFPPKGQPYGSPFHGLVYVGELYLPNGEKMPYPQPTTDSYHQPMAGRTFPIGPSWAPGGANTQSDIDAGRTWRNYAQIAGLKGQIHGQELGRDCWLWAEAEGKVWKVEPQDTLDARDAPKDVTFRLARFGWFGDPTDGELERNITITIPQNAPDDTPSYGRFQGLTLDGTDIECLLAEANPNDGHAAVFVSVMKRASNEDYGYAIACAFEVDLVAETANVIAMHDPDKGGTSETTYVDKSFTKKYEYNTDTVVATHSCNGGTIEERAGVFIEVASSCTINYRETHRVRYHHYIVAAGYDGDAASALWFRADERYDAFHDESHQTSGQDKVYVSQTTGVQPEDCGHVDQYGNATWAHDQTSRVEYPITWKLESTSRGVVLQNTLDLFEQTKWHAAGDFNTSTTGSAPFESSCGCGDSCITEEITNDIDYSVYTYNSGSYNNLTLMGVMVWDYSVAYGDPGYSTFHTYQGSAPNAMIVANGVAEYETNQIEKVVTGGGQEITAANEEYTPSSGVPVVSVDYKADAAAISFGPEDPIALV